MCVEGWVDSLDDALCFFCQPLLHGSVQPIGAANHGAVISITQKIVDDALPPDADTGGRDVESRVQQKHVVCGRNLRNIQRRPGQQFVEIPSAPRIPADGFALDPGFQFFGSGVPLARVRSAPHENFCYGSGRRLQPLLESIQY
jgi:hypothetical protein